MNAFITGATGRIGSAVTKELASTVELVSRRFSKLQKRLEIGPRWNIKGDHPELRKAFAGHSQRRERVQDRLPVSLKWAVLPRG